MGKQHFLYLPSLGQLGSHPYPPISLEICPNTHLVGLHVILACPNTHLVDSHVGLSIIDFPAVPKAVSMFYKEDGVLGSKVTCLAYATCVQRCALVDIQ